MPAPAKHPAVDDEIKAAASWYEDRCLGLGNQFIDATRSVTALISASPLRFAIRFADVRRARLPRFPYSVWYCVSGGRVYILSVLHDKREHRAILEPRRPES
ncbi:MAG: type II toxin-antitoxin system RelE/ParE family toxin [Verrucomicrobiota bacterium]|jgi:plasmid stabilization system protein ParE